MNPLRTLIQTIDKINYWVGEVLSYLLFVMFALILLEVLLRYVFNSPTVWANELTQYLFGAYAVLSGGYILLSGGHVNVDIIYSHLSPRTKAGLDIFTSLLFFLFCGMLFYYGGSLAMESLSIWEHSESAWNPPLYPVKMMIPIGSLLVLLQGVNKLILDIYIVLGYEPPVVHATEAGDSL